MPEQPAAPMTIEAANVSEGLERVYGALRWLYTNGVKTDHDRPKWVSDVFNDAFDSRRIAQPDAPPPREAATVSPPLPSPGVERIVETGSKYKTLDEFCEALFTEKDERRLDTLIGEAVTIMHELAALSALPLDGGLE